MTMGESLEFLFIPQTAKPGLGEISLLQGWKCGFICLGLSLPPPVLPFLGFVVERGAWRAGVWWCAGGGSLAGCGRWL